MTKLPITRHKLFDSSWLPKILQWFLTPLFAWPRPLRQKGCRFDTRLRRYTQNSKKLSTHSRLRIPGMHEIIGSKMRALYTCPRGIFRSRRW
jgi:hypothetical protein